MRTLRDFRCENCGELVEKLVDTNMRVIDCPECDGECLEQLSMPTVKLEGLSGAFPGAYNKWAQIREDNARIKAKRE